MYMQQWDSYLISIFAAIALSFMHATCNGEYPFASSISTYAPRSSSDAIECGLPMERSTYFQLKLRGIHLFLRQHAAPSLHLRHACWCSGQSYSIHGAPSPCVAPAHHGGPRDGVSYAEIRRFLSANLNFHGSVTVSAAWYSRYELTRGLACC